MKSQTNKEGIKMAEITYHREGDYLIPDLTAPEEPNVGVWGRRRKEFLRMNRNPIYTGMLLGGTLNAHLEETDRAANELFDRLIKEYAAAENVTEELKAENQLEWLRRMNSIRRRTEELIYQELIFC